MASQPCGTCTKTVYNNEKLEAAAKWYHKGCFKCQDDSCKIQLTLKTFKAAEGSVWCDRHVPKAKATQVADSVATQHAMNAPKKTAEGLHKTQVANGNYNYGLDTVANQHAMNAPKKPIENIGNVQKGGAASRDQLNASQGHLEQTYQEEPIEA